MKTRASIEAVAKVLNSHGAPARITQRPFDGDPGHYGRLCNLGGSQPDGLDLLDYALDLQYMEVQPDLLRYLTPVLLRAWRKHLVEGSASGYAGFVEQFWAALLEGEALRNVYSKLEVEAVSAYMKDTILDQLDAEVSLHFSGNQVTAYRWIAALVSYGVLFSDLEVLWNCWWHVQTPGHAVCAFQYASALMYGDDQNPVFNAWTRDEGGGPPALWHGDVMSFNVGWKTENLDFLKNTLSADYLEQKLRLALDQIDNPAARKIASGIVSDIPGHRARLQLRIEQLPILLQDVSQLGGFII